MSRRRAFLTALQGALGCPYTWGGQGPDGYDCSGLMLYCLNEAGFNLPDMTADDLYEKYHNTKILKSDAQPGSLFFYWNVEQSKLSHVMAVYRQWPCGYRVLAGARGGNASTVTDREAAELGAMVAVVPETYMAARFAFAIDPFME